MSERADRSSHLLVRAGPWVAAIPLAHVVETMRPLRVEAVAGMPAFARGLSVIRGTPTPVVDVGVLLGEPAGAIAGRFVALRVGDRRVAVTVDAVLGTWELSASELGEMPGLLGHGASDLVEQIGVLDAVLLVVLRLSRVLPDSTWQALARAAEVP